MLDYCEAIERVADMPLTAETADLVTLAYETGRSVETAAMWLLGVGDFDPPNMVSYCGGTVKLSTYAIMHHGISMDRIARNTGCRGLA